MIQLLVSLMFFKDYKHTRLFAFCVCVLRLKAKAGLYLVIVYFFFICSSFLWKSTCQGHHPKLTAASTLSKSYYRACAAVKGEAPFTQGIW